MKAICIIRTDNNMIQLANRCKQSFFYFHPDIECEVVNADYYIPRPSPTNCNKLSLVTGIFDAYMKMTIENYDLVIFLDADTVVTGRLSGMLTEDYDIATSQSETNDYPNAGVWSCRCREFVKEFFDLDNISNVNDNTLFALLVNYYGNKCYKKIKKLDDNGFWYNERSRRYWDNLIVIEDGLYVNNENDFRQIKVLHWAGGMGLGQYKRMSCSLFSEQVKLWLNKITNGITFTEYVGKEFGDCIKGYYNV